MRTDEKLYSKIPPSLRRGFTPFIPAQKSDFWCFWGDLLFSFLLKKKFASLRVKNPHYINKRDKTKPTIIYAPHICWWDGILAYFLCRKILKLDTIYMAEELHVFPPLRKLGVFSVDKKSPKNILKSLNFAISHLNSFDKALFIYPQGIICPQDSLDFEFNSGLEYIASHSDGVNLLPLSIRYGFLRESSPEILVEINEPIVFDKKIKNKNLDFLFNHFKWMLEKQKDEISKGDLKGYVKIFEKNDNIFRVIEKNIKTK